MVAPPLKSYGRTRTVRSLASLLIAAVAVSVTQCGGGDGTGPPPPDTTPAAIGVVSGGGQKALIGSLLANPLSVKVTNSAGSGLSGVTVSFSVVSGSATLSTTSATTNSSGNAEITVTLGNVGEDITIRASVSGVSTPADFTVTALAPTTIEVSAGDSLRGPAGTTLSAAFQALVRDQETNDLGGVEVSWTITDSAGPGASLSTLSSVTSAAGIATSTLTLGSAGGSYGVSAAFTGVATPATFTAIALVPGTIVIAGGNGQSRPITGTLPNPLQVLVSDQFGVAFAGITVDWAITAAAGAGASLASATSVTDAAGLASNTLTLGGTPGSYEVTASVAGLIQTTVFNQTAVLAPLIASISPDPAREGFAATITGSNFDPVAANNTVTVDGVAATVTAATATSLDISVPATACLPARDNGQFVVSVGGVAGPVFSHRTIPGDSSISLLAAGNHSVRSDAASVECTQFPAQAGASSFLVIPAVATSTSGLTASERITSTTGSSTIFAVGGFNLVAPTVRPRDRSKQWSAGPLPRADLEGQLRAYERELILRHGAQARAQFGAGAMAQNLGAAGAAIPVPGVGDTVQVKVLTALSGDLCNTFTTIDAVARSVGMFSVALEDTAAPAGGFTTADYNAIVAEFDAMTSPTDITYFGPPSDLDTNGVTFLVYTPEVNKLTPPGTAATQGFLAGFFFGGDLFGTAACAQSNVGELFYSLVPDPGNVFGNVFFTADVRQITRGTAAHEFQHLINAATRIFGPGSGVEESWLNEALSHLAEEVVGHAVTGLMPGSNLTFATAAANVDDFNAFYVQNFGRLDNYLADPAAISVIGDAAMELAVRGAAWNFMRWVLDQEATPATEASLTRALVATSLSGVPNVEAAVGKNFEDLLSEWLLALFADDFIAVVDPRITVPSWHMRDIFTNLSGSFPLATTSIGFADGVTDFTVVSASGRYFVLSSGAASPAMAFRLTNQADSRLDPALAPRLLLLRLP